jgi:DNA polymerase-3 subunit delta
MKIDTKDIDQTIKNLTKVDSFKSVLLYGESNSSLETRYRDIVSTFRKRKYEMVDLTPEDMKSNEGSLAAKFVTRSMFFIGTLFKLKLLGKGNNYTRHIENLFRDIDLTDNNNFLLITSEPLETNSSLRKYAEKSKYLACIPCYEENLKDMSSFIRRKLKEYDFSFDNNTVEYIASINDCTVVAENEILKLDLFKDEDRNLIIDDIRECLVDTAAVDMDNFMESFCSFNIAKTYDSLDRIIYGGIEPIAIVRAMLRHFLLLQRICYSSDEGSNIEDIFRNEKLFWKLQISLRSYIENWNLESVGHILEEIMDMEKSVKFSSRNRRILENFLLQYLSNIRTDRNIVR